MNTEELQKLAKYARSTREMGVALITGSAILALFLFVTPISVRPSESTVAIATSTAPNSFEDIQLEAKAVIVYDLATGETLYERNADAQLPLASLTKLLTVYAALTVLSQDTPITIPESAINLDGPHAFSTGQIFTLYDLARLTLTASLNDGAIAIATAMAEQKNISQSDMLASVASALDLSQTYAVNGSGLDVNTAISGGYGSARDVARLAGALVELAPEISKATTVAYAQATSRDGKSFKVANTDTIVGTLPHLLLSKTGYTDLAGGSMALVFDAGIMHPIAIVVLGSSMNSRFTDSATLVAGTLAHFAGVQSL